MSRDDDDDDDRDEGIREGRSSPGRGRRDDDEDEDRPRRRSSEIDRRDDFGGENPRAERARARTNVPGILLIVAGVLNLLGGLYFAFNGFVSLSMPAEEVMKQANAFNPQQEAQMKQLGWSAEAMVRNTAIGYIILGVLAIVGAIITLMGGVKIRNLQGYGLGMFGAIIACIPCLSSSSCCVFGLVAGIWAVVALLDADVKAEFR
jgi:hypothetical protein